MLSLDDNRSRRKSTPGDQSMRRSIQDLVSSIDPNVKIEPEVEDVSFFAFNVVRMGDERCSGLWLMRGFAAAAGHRGRVHRLGHELWVSPREASRERHA